MSDFEKARAVGAGRLLRELRRREAVSKSTELRSPLIGDRAMSDLFSRTAEVRNLGRAETSGSGIPSEPELEEIPSNVLYEALRASETSLYKAIYDEDNRCDLFDVSNGAILEGADAVVGIFLVAGVTEQDDSVRLQTRPYWDRGRNGVLCENEPFRNQPVGPFGTGFLVAPDMVATAGHCLKDGHSLEDIEVTDLRFAFGFRMMDEETPVARLPRSEVYRGSEVVAQALLPSGEDWALVRLDREVDNHRPVPVRRAEPVVESDPLYVIGHPAGLPLKYAGGAYVRDNRAEEYFVANLDTYGGNSGSPVFDARTHEVVGILVRGEPDYVTVDGCVRSRVCPASGCRGEDCTRISLLAHLIP